MGSSGGDGHSRGPTFDVFAGDPTVGADLAAVDWAVTPLGSPKGWPQSLRTAVDILLSSRFAMWMAWGPDLTFFCNAAYRRDTLGERYPWALGRPTREVWAEIWEDISPRIDQVLTTGEATWDEALLLFVERAGYREESYHTFSYSPLRDDDGNVAGMLCVVSEETERVIGDRRMAVLRDLGSDPSVIRTVEEAVDFAAQQLGANLRDLPFTATYLAEDDGSYRLAGTSGIRPGHPAAPEVLAAGDPRAVWPVADVARGESVHVALDGARLPDLPAGAWTNPPTHALLVPLLRQGDTPYGFLVAALNRYRQLDDGYRGFVELVAGYVAACISAARNYQEQQRRAEALAELDRAKTTFFSNISHEFRTPLTLIMGPVDELRRHGSGLDERARDELEVIHRNGLRLGKLVNALLDFSRIEAGRMQARYEPVDLAVATTELASLFRSAIDRAGLTFDVDCPPLDEPVYLDRGLWEKAVLNLLSNALKFTFEGSITVAVRRAGDSAVVTVADTGVGVSAAEVPRLFERFHRIENTRSRSHEGSGIGLALVRELVELHGGTITADSAEGVGTTFTIRLPFGTDHLPPESVASTAVDGVVSQVADSFVLEALRWLPETSDVELPGRGPVQPVAAVPARVLIADDNADMRGYLARLLSGAGYHVVTVPDGVEALAAVRAGTFDMVVTDVMMPRLDGLSLVAALRADSRTAAMPVLVLSARAGQEASIEGLQAGADDYLVKPFAAAELLARVRANVELARMRMHHARWRTALIDSLQEAFFVCDEDGAVVEINAAFTEILGYGAEGLPYRPAHPWWPDPSSDPLAYQQVADVFAALPHRSHSTHSVPVVHRDGHTIWISVQFNPAQDPETGRRVTVGTFRDVTAERYAIQRDSALASLSTRLTQAGSLTEALAGAMAEFASLWRADVVLAAVFDDDEHPALLSTDGSHTWAELPTARRQLLTELRARPVLGVHTGDTGLGVLLEHPHGPLALWIETGSPRPFTSDDRLLLSVLAGHLAQGLARVHQNDEQRETAITLQRAILGPSHLPDGFAVRYEPATRRLEVGGDWYDTVALPDGRIGIVVGDCVGHGLEAATVMGQLRSACRALLLRNPSPAEALTALDQFAAVTPGAACTTVFCGVLDPETGRLVYSSAGHPPGILAHADGTSQLLEGGRSVPLAVRHKDSRPEGECVLPAHTTLLLYTDGLVERRRSTIDEGIERAGEAVHHAREAGVEDLADGVMARLAPTEGYDDDVAVLLYRHPTPLTLTFPTEPGQLARVRTALRGWLDRCDMSPEAAQDIVVAAAEACANALEHGHVPTASFTLRAEASVDVVRLTVVDSGSREPACPEDDAHRNRLDQARAAMDRVDVTSGASGTVVEMYTNFRSAPRD